METITVRKCQPANASITTSMASDTENCIPGLLRFFAGNLGSVPTKEREVPQDFCDVIEINRKISDLLLLKNPIRLERSFGSKIC